MTVERMTPQDLAAVVELGFQLGYSNRLDAVAERFARICDHPNYALFVAKSATCEVVGWVQINREAYSLLVGDSRADLAALVVDEKHRGRGIGKALVERAEQWAKSNGLSLVRVKSNIKREGAHRFYQREGFALAKTAHVFTKSFSE